MSARADRTGTPTASTWTASDPSRLRSRSRSWIMRSSTTSMSRLRGENGASRWTSMKRGLLACLRNRSAAGLKRSTCPTWRTRPRSRARRDQVVCLLERRGDRLLHQHVLAGLEQQAHDPVVVHRGDRDRHRVRGGDHRFQRVQGRAAVAGCDLARARALDVVDAGERRAWKPCVHARVVLPQRSHPDDGDARRHRGASSRGIPQTDSPAASALARNASLSSSSVWPASTASTRAPASRHRLDRARADHGHVEARVLAGLRDLHHHRTPRPRCGRRGGSPRRCPPSPPARPPRGPSPPRSARGRGWPGCARRARRTRRPSARPSTACAASWPRRSPAGRPRGRRTR